MPYGPLVELTISESGFLHVHMRVHRIVMIQVGVFEPFSFDEKSITSIRRSSACNFKTIDPWFSIIFPKEIADWIISSNKGKISVERIIFFEVGVVSLIDRSVEFELLEDLFEEGGTAKVIVGT